MNLDPTVTAAIVAAIVSVIGGFISYISSRSAVLHEVQQSQVKDILAKRIELYPKLWRIHIYYETNWTFEGKTKTREWAEQYVASLNEFNLEGGLFFSESLYNKFAQLRSKLYEAIETTQPGGNVEERLALEIRRIVYGNGSPGMSTYLKDDLGSYRSATLQIRKNA
jgi:hypothetical protein